MKTRLLDDLPPQERQGLASQHAPGRRGETAELRCWLASDRASVVTGNFPAADGGYLSH